MESKRVRGRLVPHATEPAVLERQRQVYARGQTPVVVGPGRQVALPVAPGSADLAGRHLGQIAEQHGESGLQRSVHGLAVTRGVDFARLAVDRAGPAVRTGTAGTAVSAVLRPEGSADERALFAVDLMRQSHGVPASPQVRRALPASLGHRLDAVRVHDDAAAHRAARQLGARAVTLGHDVYLGEGEHRPDTEDGRHLLAHELAHALQHPGGPAPQHGLRVSEPGSPEEREADAYADALRRGDVEARPPSPRPSAAHLKRVISFTTSNHAVTTQRPGTRELPGGTAFRLANGVPAAPHFDWTADATVHGHAGDPFSDFQIGPMQVLRSWWFNVWWGTGADRTHRRGTVTTPIRDALSGNTWYADVLASSSFGAAGDVRSTRLLDSPGITSIPLANPVAGRTSTRGWFNYGVAFVAYLAARDTTAGAGGFRPLDHVYWNLSLDGTFDSTAPAGSRVSVSSAATNASRVRSGGSAADPMIIGGSVPNDVAVITTT